MLLNSYIYTGTFYGPLSVRINGVDCLDLQDLAGGGGGGGLGWEARPTTVVPCHFQLRSLTGL